MSENTTTARFVTTVDEFLELLNEAVIGLLPKAYEAHANGTLGTPVEFVREQAAMIAGVIDIESDDILGVLISLGHEPTVCNDDAVRVVEVALARALTQRMAEDNVRASIEEWTEQSDEVFANGERTPENAVRLATLALDVVADLYDYAIRCGVRRSGTFAIALRDTYAKALAELRDAHEDRIETSALLFCTTVAQVLTTIGNAGGLSAFMASVVSVELGERAAA